MTITIKNDGTIEPFGIYILRESRFQLLPTTRDMQESSAEFDGEVDFGTELNNGHWTLVAATEEGLSAAGKMESRRDIAKLLNDFRDGEYLSFESDDAKQIFVLLEGRAEVEEYPTWLKVRIPLKVAPLWESVAENEVTDNFPLEDVLGGNYVSYGGVTYLSLTGGNRRVMDLDLSAESVWGDAVANPDWPTRAELENDDWTNEMRAAANRYWTSTEDLVNNDYAILVHNGIPVGTPGTFILALKTLLENTRLCQTLPANTYIISGTGTLVDPYILDVLPLTLALTNSGTFETPIIIDLLASPSAVTSPSIGIGDDTLQYQGIIPEGETLIINTEYGTVIVDDANALNAYVGNFPKIPPGDTTVSYAGGGVLTVKWHDRWL